MLEQILRLKWRVLLLRRKVEASDSTGLDKQRIGRHRDFLNPWMHLSISPKDTQPDIERFIEAQIDASLYARELLHMGTPLRQEIVRTVCQSSEGS
jgi:hypothetical protein